MSQNPNIRIFTAEQLQEHDLELAAKIHQISTTSVVRKLNKMNPGEILNASRKNGKSLYWSEEKLNQVLSHIDKN